MTLRLLLMLADGVAAAVVFLLVSVVRFESDPGAKWSVGIDVGVAAVLFAIMWVTVLWALGLYRLRVRWSLRAEARDIARATVVVLAISLSTLFVLHQDDVSRLFLLILFVVQPFAALLSRALLRSWFERLRRGGSNMSFMLVAGTGALAQQFADTVEAHAELGVRVLGHLSVPATTYRLADYGESGGGLDEGQALSRPILGSIDEMHAIFHDRIVDEVAVCLAPASSEYLEPIIAVAADEGKTVRVPRDLEEGILSGALQEEFDRFLVKSVVHDGHRDLERAVKRLFDVLAAITALVILSPILLISAVLIRMRDGSPVLFRQTRVGLHGRAFSMIKFRTMEAGAEERLADLAARNEIKGPAFKITNDPRVTRLGAFLRASSLDELPQLVNVLKGEMSLVGPRPALPHEVANYDLWHRRRLSVRPGITGLWQIEARSDEQFDNRATLDLRYIDQWSLWMDLGIILRTVPALLMRPGK